MKNIKKIMLTGALVLSISSLSVGVFAQSNYDTPAEAVADLTDKTVEQVQAQRRESKDTYGKIAADAGKLEEFKAKRQEMREDQLAKQVVDKKITQEKADEILAKVKANQENCDGSQMGHQGDGEGLKLNAGQNGLGLKNNEGQQAGHGLKNNEGGQHRSGLRLQDGTGAKDRD